MNNSNQHRSDHLTFNLTGTCAPPGSEAGKTRAFTLALEALVRQRTSELEISNKELEAFGYSVSHDLRAPLRIINAYSAILMDESSHKLNDDEKNCVQVIIDNAARMSRLIDDLMAFSRLGSAAPQKQDVDMDKLVQTVIGEIKEHDPHFPPVTLYDLPAATCDRGLMKQVWTNLISNAVKYSHKNPDAQIEIGTHSDEGITTYYIRDNGAGFDMRYAHKLFEVFQRLHHASDYEGTGVGLALTQRIIHKHGGKIWAEAKTGEGATFYFSLPEVCS